MWIEPADDYEVKPGDLVQITLHTGFIQPAEWAIRDILAFTDWEFQGMEYQGSDLILRVKRAPVDPDAPVIIQAGAVPAIIQGLLVAAGIGLITFLIVKDFKIWCDDEGCGIQTQSSLSGLVIVAALGVGLVWFSQK